MPTTPVFGWRVPGRTDKPNGRKQINELALDIEDTLQDVLQFPGLHVRQLDGQSINNNTETKLSWDATALANVGFTWSGGTDIVVPEAGTYLAVCTVRWTANSTGYRRVSLYANTLYGDQSAPSIGSVSMPQCVSMMLVCTAGTVIDVRVTQTSGSALELAETSRTPSVAVWRIA